VFNGAEYITETLDSILCQDYTDFEVVISDNASTDATQEICESYARRDPRIRYSRLSENVGAARNYNRVFGLASGEFFKWAAHDDLLAPRFLSACVAAFDAGPPEAVLVHPHTTVINEVGQTIRGPGDDPDRTTDLDLSTRLERMLAKPDDFQSILHRCFPVFGLFRRSALQKTSLIANFPRSDMLVLVELALLGPVIALDEQLFIKRKHPEDSITRVEAQAHAVEQDRIIARRFAPQRRNTYPATFTRLGWGFLSTVLKASFRFGDRIRAIGLVLAWHWGKRPRLLTEAKIVSREQVTRAVHSLQPSGRRSQPLS
jgi:glycosyltransferase involved in cell wall biosynthesis